MGSGSAFSAVGAVPRLPARRSRDADDWDDDADDWDDDADDWDDAGDD
jgi:hypothetical protein